MFLIKLLRYSLYLDSIIPEAKVSALTAFLTPKTDLYTITVTFFVMHGRYKIYLIAMSVRVVLDPSY